VSVSFVDIVALIGASAALITSVVSFVALWMKFGVLEVKVDGRLTQLIELTAKSSHAEGVLSEKDETHQEQTS
jgi:hypothetical protein